MTKKLWLDDRREAPRGWLHVRTAAEAIRRIRSGEFTHLDLDYDLSLTDREGGTGYDVACAIEKGARNGSLPRMLCECHSGDPLGRQRIEAALARAGMAWRARDREQP